MSKRILISAIAVAAIGTAAPLAAQERSAVSSAELDAAIGRTIEQRTSDQRAIRDFLESERARAVTANMGVGTEDLTTRVAGLDDATLRRIADAVRDEERVLAGGDTIVISTTAVIIGLLILILLTD